MAQPIREHRHCRCLTLAEMPTSQETSFSFPLATKLFHGIGERFSEFLQAITLLLNHGNELPRFRLELSLASREIYPYISLLIIRNQINAFGNVFSARSDVVDREGPFT